MSLKEEVAELKSFVTEQKEKGIKEKKFKFPFGKKVGKSQRRKNYVTVLVINENSSYEFKKYQIEDQTIVHDLIPRLATSGHTLFDKSGNPMVILPNWSVEPFSPVKSYQDSLENGSNTTGYKILMAKMQSNTIDGKKKISGMFKWILGIGLAAIVGYAFISGGGI